MICDRCHGSGMLDETYLLPVTRDPRKYNVTCPDCGGSGITHCCEGERPDCATPEISHDEKDQEQ